ncbi:hypothetical protein JR316_0012149 [Psilocybe cubensis]|uniref:Uncharacterized protein n=1 Tax=Psilocybe cubensis TaxID=181762 RepID=A0ACB8GIL2_PSICU|nr:hypothetical protein JR316_0012149 [Psilocybe cubensis]KAH9475046.1 hypothetical protein JR316_0012149 [Psilocybe cubensis]
MNLSAAIQASKPPDDHLIKEQREIRTKINALHDPITRRLSRETVSSIFLYALPDVWYLDDEDDYSAGCGDGDYDNVYVSDRVYGPLALGAVCQSWRKLAWNTPSLWTNIRIFFQRRPDLNDLQVVTEWLKRSGNLPLSIRLSEYNDSDSSDFEPSQRAVHNLFIDLVNQYSDRWRYLEFEGLPETTTLVGKDHNFAPFLRTLSVQYARDEGAIFGAMSGAKPRPTNVWARYCRFSALSIDWSHVTNISMTGIRLPECFMVLQASPQLTHCRWSIEESNDKSERLPPPPVLSSPKLHEALQIMHISGWKLPWPLKSGPTAPHLVHLTLDQLDYGHSKHDVDFLYLLANTSLPYDPQSNNDNFTVTLLPNLQSIKYMRKHGETWPTDCFWDCVPYIIGPIQQIHHPRGRPLKSIRIGWLNTGKELVPQVMRKETVLKLLEISAAGIVLDLTEKYSRHDLLKLSMNFHGIVPKHQPNE